MASIAPLEGDGLVENLFYFLWSKDDFGGGPRVFVPHTVIFKLSQPIAWYFTSLRSSKIKKKSRVNLTNTQIEHEFTKKKSPTDIVATYIYLTTASGARETSAATSTAPAPTIIEYFDAAALREFLYKRDKPHGGMLQKFVLPKGTSNTTVRAIWSPKICLLERTVNRRNVYDKRFGVYERGVTFDGPVDAYSFPEPVRGAALPGEVQALCETVVDHVTRVTYHKYRISRMVLHLKTDASDRLWLLWCSSLRLSHVGLGASGSLVHSPSDRVHGNRPVDLVRDAQVPEFAPFGRQTYGGAASMANVSIDPAVGRQRAGALAISSHVGGDHGDHALLFGQARCSSCGGLVDRKKLLPTMYKAIIEHFARFLKFLRVAVNEREGVAITWPPENKYIDAAGGVGFGILPFINGDCASTSPNARRVLSSSTNGDNSCASALLTRVEFVIPPVIRFLHPNFSVSDFERHRRDPIFLHKQAGVCESCCLVYADYSTSALEVNSIRQSAPALLRPHLEISELRRRLDPLDPLTCALSISQPKPDNSNSPSHSRLTQKEKPPADAWKPLTSTQSETIRSSPSERKPTRFVHKSQKPTRMLRFPSAPDLPERIDSFEELRDADCDHPVRMSNNHTVADREERFFRELYGQKALAKGHPLRHMVDSASRLEDARVKLGGKKLQRLAALGGGGYKATLMGSTASTGALAEAVAETEQSAKAQHWKSPYSVVQRLREPSDDSDSVHMERAFDSSGVLKGGQSPEKTPGKRKRKKSKKQAKDSSMKSTIKGGPNEERTAKAGVAKFVSSKEKRAADEHRDFLFAALSEAKGQLEHIESLAMIVPADEDASGEKDTEEELSQQQAHDQSSLPDSTEPTEAIREINNESEDEVDEDDDENDEDEDEDDRDEDEGDENEDESDENEDEGDGDEVHINEGKERQTDPEHLDGGTDITADESKSRETANEPNDTTAAHHDTLEPPSGGSALTFSQDIEERKVESPGPTEGDGDIPYSNDWRLAAAIPLPTSDGGFSSSISASTLDDSHTDQLVLEDSDADDDDGDEGDEGDEKQEMY